MRDRTSHTASKLMKAASSPGGLTVAEPATSDKHPRTESLRRAKPVRTVLCLLSAWIACACTANDVNLYTSVTVAPDGGRAAFIHHKGDEKKLIVAAGSSLSVVRTLPGPPTDATFDRDGTLLVVVADRGKTTRPRRLIRLTKEGDRIIENLVTSSGVLSSVRATVDGGQVYLAGDAEALERWPMGKWHLRKADGSVRLLSDDWYGYRFAPSVLDGVGVLIDFPSKSQAITLVPFSPDAKLPRWVAELGERSNARLRCDTMPSVCLSVPRRLQSDGLYAHDLDVVTATRACRVALKDHWIEAADVSSNGKVAALVGAIGPREARGGHASLTLLDLSSDSCSPSVKMNRSLNPLTGD